MRTTKELLGARIREVRKARQLSQDALAEKVGVDPKQISRIEGGKSYPSLDTLDSIARELQVEVKELFNYEHISGDKDITEEISRTIAQMDDAKKVLALRLLRTLAS